MSSFEQLSRRAFIRDLGKGTLAVAILGAGAIACSSDSDSSTAATTAGQGPTTSGTPPTTTGAAATTSTTQASTSDAVAWERVNLGNVSAYLLTRGTEAAVVDTGNPGSLISLEQALWNIGLAWGNVGHVILTHRHNDHIGSLGAIMDAASDADGYAGEADIPSMGASPRPLIPVGDDDQVFGLDIIETPGHTPGHISVLDSVGGLLVAGDALFGDNGGVIGSIPAFTTDQAQADESVKKLATLKFETVVFGHGNPIEGGADAAVAALAANL